MISTVEFLKACIQKLDNTSTKDFAVLYVELKMQCVREYQHGLIFSIRVTGPYFFHNALKMIEGKDLLKAERGETLSEYDENFNRWIKIVRKEISA